MGVESPCETTQAVGVQGKKSGSSMPKGDKEAHDEAGFCHPHPPPPPNCRVAQPHDLQVMLHNALCVLEICDVIVPSSGVLLQYMLLTCQGGGACRGDLPLSVSAMIL